MISNNSLRCQKNWTLDFNSKCILFQKTKGRNVFDNTEMGNRLLIKSSNVFYGYNVNIQKKKKKFQQIKLLRKDLITNIC